MAAPTVTTPLLAGTTAAAALAMPISGTTTAAAPTPATAFVHDPIATRMGMAASPLPLPSPPQASLSTRLQRAAVTTFAVLRCLRGVSLVTYPAFGLYALDIPLDGSSFMLASLIGVRDILLAGMLYTADTAGLETEIDAAARREVTRALTATLLGDAMDTFVLIFYAAWSDDWGNPLAVIVITAVMAMCEHLTLWSMVEDDMAAEGGGGVGGDAYADNQSMEHDKQLRMSAWLRELENGTVRDDNVGRAQSRAPSSRATFAGRARSMSRTASMRMHGAVDSTAQLPMREGSPFYI